MRLSRLFTCSVGLTAVVMLGACDSTGPTTPVHSSSSCAPDGVKEVSPTVRATPPGSGGHNVPAASQPLVCGTTLTVTSYGKAQVQFGSLGPCQLSPHNYHPAGLTSRDPAGTLMTLHAGHLTCSLAAPPPSRVNLACPYGDVMVTAADFIDICARDPIFLVAVYTGSVQVIGLNGQSYPLHAGQALYFDFSAGIFKKGAAQLFLSKEDYIFFHTQKR